MKPELIISSVAIVISIAGFVFSIISWVIGRKTNVTTATLNTFAQFERSLSDVPTALKFHGIDPEQLEELGITPKEFAYLVANFSAGYIYHYGIYPDNVEPLKVGSYQYNILLSPFTRKVWPLIKIMMGEGNYVKMIESTIQEIEKTTAEADYEKVC